MIERCACLNCGHKISEVEIDCDINGRIAARPECDNFEPRKDTNDGWDLVDKIYKHCDKECWYGGGDDIRDGMDYVYKEIMGIIDEYKGKK